MVVLVSISLPGRVYRLAPGESGLCESRQGVRGESQRRRYVFNPSREIPKNFMPGRVSRNGVQVDKLDDNSVIIAAILRCGGEGWKFHVRRTGS
ncbi:hypothetical protein D3C80_1026710 [compost metagenome]